ncbi:DNA mismatch repair endonuclease MutL [Abiotrophia sp.]|uniref:DNA mismatch repair endonuclease MutL n=1 Tax=Abiotrophia sp. TaxID=76631 RepID=UPI001CB394F4|nr:DNA mismatch repair endonuclease MutL [Abiotrophia sp.]MBF0936487.1 DNA mismatch repair endonuclease MutL [Abiotrophia sp.]
MGKIQQMPEALANQIAAGEVVERPASVVKELVENAIDAGAQTIRVELREAGIQQVKVIDDGEGMDAEDLAKAFLPHATSKLYDVHDLFQIKSLGFRGEALASIGSVAKVRVESMQAGAEAGHYIEIAGSQVRAQGMTSARKGTTLTVDSLFYNTPARLKHLSSLKTELKHSLNFIQDIAMAYPDIRFHLVNDGQTIFQSFGTGDLRQTIANVYQPALARQLIALEAENLDFKIKGYISPPQLTRTSKHYIHWMINGRAVRSYALTELLLRAYGRQLMIGRYPLAVIAIELDPRLVDVNVHPTKQTVRLSKESELGQLLTQAVVESLASLNPVPNAQVQELAGGRLFQQTNQANPQPPAASQVMPLDLDGKGSESPFDSVYEEDDDLRTSQASKPAQSAPVSQVAESLAPDWQDRQVEPVSRVEDLEPSPSQPLEAEPVAADSQVQSQSSVSQDLRPSFGHLRYVGQIHGTYLIAESPEGFYLIDQHAAQERIRYEAFMKQEMDTKTQQTLLLPYLFHFSPAELSGLDQVLPRLEELGIVLEAFGPKTYQLASYPTWLEAHEVEQTVRDLTERLVKQPDLSINQIKEAALIMQSCRGAIKANHYLDDSQASYLIQALDGLDDPFHCPHGRPVFVQITDKTLEKLFKRIQDPHQGGHQL